MSKAKTTATAQAGAKNMAPITVAGIEFTPKMIEDLTTLATLESSVKGDKKAAEKIKNVFKPFTEENESALRENWIRVGNLRVKLEVTRSLKVEIVD